MKPGIYRITIEAGDKRYAYIGQSMHTNKRWAHHLWYLRKAKHANPIMQRMFEKYGESNFKYELIKTCEVSELTKNEQECLDNETLETINCSPVVDAPRRGMKNSERQKEAARLSNRNRVISDETKAKISASGKGRKAWNKGLKGQEAWNKGLTASDEQKKKLSEAHKGKPWSEARRKAYNDRWAIDVLG